MNRKVNGLVKAAASISLAGGILAMAAGPAFAAAPNESYAAAATGVITAAPIGLASYPTGTSPVNVLNANIAGILTTGVVHDTADATSASSTINSTAVTLSGLASLATGIITSSCSLNTDTGTVTGTATIANGAVTVGGIQTLTLAANPAANTGVTVPGVAQITLNRQVTAPDGTLEVDAIYVSLLGSAQTLTIGASICNTASVAPVSILPGMAMPIGLGTLGLLALGGTAYYFGRRRRVTVAA